MGPRPSGSAAPAARTSFDSTWNADQGYLITSTGAIDNASQATIRADAGSVPPAGPVVQVKAGELRIDNSVLELNTSTGAGLVARPLDTTAATVKANFVTVVEGGAGSVGALADATVPTAKQTASVTLLNSIVRGQTTSLRAAADNDGAQGGNSTATVMATFTDYVNLATAPGTHGTATVPTDATNLVNVDPMFLNPQASNYDLRAGAPVIDKGSASGGLPDDRNGRNRPFDGDRNGVAVPDLGAYELSDATAPVTTITGGPSGATNDNTPVFTFRSSPDATFECQIDGSAFQKCGNPVTTTPLADGPHLFAVRDIDEVFNVEAAPPMRAASPWTPRHRTRR